MKFQNHTAVLINEVISFWKNKGYGIFVDCTFGRGGHSQALLNVINQESKLIGIDVDYEAVLVGKKLAQSDFRFIIKKANFSQIKQVLIAEKIQKVDGILFDFGVSSPQLENVNRGFSFHKDGLLDMRMDLSLKKTAADLLANASIKELNQIFKKFGDCNNSWIVAKKIVSERKTKPIVSTLQLVEIIKNALPKKKLYVKKHFAQVYFQAIRIWTNQEFESIKLVLKQLKHVLNPDGVVVFITFHSLEEKIIKKWIYQNTGYLDLKGLPVHILNDFCLITKKPILPSEAEIKNNSRSRSAKMWVIKRNHGTEITN